MLLRNSALIRSFPNFLSSCYLCASETETGSLVLGPSSEDFPTSNGISTCHITLSTRLGSILLAFLGGLAQCFK
jgi:hypothetical protein